MAFEQRMTMLTLGVANLGRARAFYESLGWRASSASQGDIAFFQNGSSAIALYPQDKLDAHTRLAGPPRPGGITLAYNTRSRAEVDERAREVVAAGGTITAPPSETEWGGYVCYFTDPDGHPWEIAFVEMFLPAEDGGIRLP